MIQTCIVVPVRTALACAVYLLLLAGVATAGEARTRVVFTVDVESNETFGLPGQVDAVCGDGTPCGLAEMARMLAARQWSGTFFLNVYEHKRWSDAALRAIAVNLQRGGQDVALHTHPQWTYDSARGAMHEYTLDEQTTIVRDGIGLLQAWVGRPVVAHRAGAYTADERTLAALERGGVTIDSSFFWQNPGNRLNGAGLSRNVPSRRGAITEIPVTVYERLERPTHFASLLPPVRVVRKIDPNWVIDAQEARDAIDAVVAARLPVLVVFLHSYSFMAGRGADGKPGLDRHGLEMLRAILDHVAARQLPVVNMRTLAEEDGTAEAADVAPSVTAADVVPTVTTMISPARYVRRQLALSTGLASRSAAGSAALLVAGSLVLLARRRGRKR